MAVAAARRWRIQRAGIWARNDNLDVTSCEIITAPAMPEIEHIQIPMPIIIDPAPYERWLSGEDKGQDAKALLLGIQIDGRIEIYQVSREVNNRR